MTKKTLKMLYQALVLIFILPAILFWVFFAYAGYSLGDFISLFGFIADGYRAASPMDRTIFVNGITMFSIVYSALLILITFIIKQGRKELEGSDV